MTTELIAKIIRKQFVKIVFEKNISIVGKENTLLVKTIVESYKKIHNSEVFFSLADDFAHGDDLLLVIYHQVPTEVKNKDDLARYREFIKAKVPGTNMDYAGKIHQLKKITGQPVMIMVLLEHRIDDVPTKEIVVPALFNAGKL